MSAMLTMMVPVNLFWQVTTLSGDGHGCKRQFYCCHCMLTAIVTVLTVCRVLTAIVTVSCMLMAIV